MASALLDRLPEYLKGEAAQGDALLDRFLGYVAARAVCSSTPRRRRRSSSSIRARTSSSTRPPARASRSWRRRLHFHVAGARAGARSTPARSRRWSTRSSSPFAATSGPEHVGMVTGDATVNRDAPILCCTAEILANIALREGARARRRRRGHGRVPLLRRPRARRGLADPAAHPAAGALSADVGDPRRHRPSSRRS